MKLHYFVSLCICFLVCLSIIVDAATPTTTPPTHVVEPACDSIVYCNNDILHTVQLSGIFNDSKSFVDAPLRASPEDVVAGFNKLPKKPSDSQLKVWIEKYFAHPGSDLKTWIPGDWQSSPPEINKIANDDMKQWAMDLNALWKTFGREVASKVGTNPEQHSLLYVPHPFIVPGGRFREFYYWDSYWVINGLLISGMNKTARGMINNFIHLENDIGFVPNGGRVYYKDRSQPPLLAEMVNHFVELQEEDFVFFEKAVAAVEKEYQWWMTHRSIKIKRSENTEYELNRYRADTNMPRPEGYAEDYNTAKKANVKDPKLPNNIYRNLASGAESGWDFSSRWFANAKTIDTIHTSNLIPVDLNCILYRNEILLHQFFNRLARKEEDSEKKQKYIDRGKVYKTAAHDRQKAIFALLWDDEIGLWFDFNLEKSAINAQHFYMSSLLPLWSKVHVGYSHYTRDYIEKRVLEAIEKKKLMQYKGGMPTSQINTGQQWDYPNGWAPLEALVISGLSTMDYAVPGHAKNGTKLASQLATKWLQNNYNGWQKTKKMYEKYDTTTVSGVPGGGGEYEVQSGFGWSNGVALELLLKYCTGGCVPISSDHNGNGGSSGGTLWWLAIIFVSIFIMLLCCAVICAIIFFIYRKRRNNVLLIPEDEDNML